jgi:glucosamine--fructose-6-phosphate aminotransferase (isomerizing)
MCGIVGVVGGKDIPSMLIEGLKCLEYRGYDSAGIATITESGTIACRRAAGKLGHLVEELKREPLSGLAGIGHTRWATHGKPTTANAHPHHTGKVAVVHNGIIENFRELRTQLEAEGRLMLSETDTEVIPHLVTKYLEAGMEPHEAVAAAVKRLEGTYALAILFAGAENLLIAARRGSPLAIGHGTGQMFVGSDAMALAPFTSAVTYLEDGDVAQIGSEGLIVWDKSFHQVQRAVRQSKFTHVQIGKGEHRHYMLKEIHEQPKVIAETLHHYINPAEKNVQLPAMPFDLAAVDHLTMIACGTSFYAAMVGKYWFEKYARLPVTIDIASEFRYREAPLSEKGLTLCISQSGESADTLAALRFARQYQPAISLVNVIESSMALESDAALLTPAGPEIGVASTKAFTTQLAVLAVLALAFADARGSIEPEERAQLLAAMARLPELMMDVLGRNDEIKALVPEIAAARDVIYIGRGTAYPLALEGALKLKEITYIHAEGLAAGELKHGPLALVDSSVPVIAVAPADGWFDKTCSNIQEVVARGGKVIAITDEKGAQMLQGTAHTLVMPEAHPFITPILYALPLQLLSYHTAVAKGNDVDQPRNLAKSVTVE